MLKEVLKTAQVLINSIISPYPYQTGARSLVVYFSKTPKKGQMHKENLERMIKLAEDFFDAKNDPAQILFSKKTMARLLKIHPATLREKKTRNGPVAWMMVVPTTHDLMNQFIKKKINERELLQKTPLRTSYDVIYLCSALVLPEHRGKGLAKRLMSAVIKSIRKQHSIKSLFYWAFSVEGKKLAASVAEECGLPLYKRMM